MPESTAKKTLQCPNCGANVDLEDSRCEYCQAVLTVTACPSCFGAVFQGMKHCPACGSAIERRELETGHPLKCPRCEQALSSVDVGGVKLRECTACGGVWLDETSFQTICAGREQQEKVILYQQPSTAPVISPAPPGRFYIPCPVCGDLMVRKNFAGCSGVIIDLCSKHGIWFDRQELSKIVGFVRDGGLHRAREREKASLKAEQQRLADMQFAQGGEMPAMPDSDVLPGFRRGETLLDNIIKLIMNDE